MIVKRLYLNMENWSVSRGSYQLGYIAENTVTLLQIATDIDTNCTYHLEQKIDGESHILYLEQGDGVLTATIPNTMLTKVGNAEWQIVGIWADESVKKSNIFNVYISDAINAESEVPASEVTAFTEALADLAGHMGEVAGYADSASDSAAEAATSAESASGYATNASTSASEASTSASEASTSAENAATSATNASASASSAATSAESASTSATSASESAESASTYAGSASASATEASASASNASASATSASMSASSASTSASSAQTYATTASNSATTAQTYAANASTSEQNCATYASNARASAEEAQEYVERLDNWTTVEFSLADFTYNKNSGVTYLPIEAPNGYKFEEIRGYIILNKTKVDSANAYIIIEPTISDYDNNINADRACRVMTVETSVTGCINRVDLDYNHDFEYITCTGSYSFTTRASVETVSSSPISRCRSISNDTIYSQSRIVIKTTIPHANISELYGKLQYRVRPIA